MLLVAAVVVVPTGSAAPPATGVLVPGKSLGGISLGMAKRQVIAAWGSRHGRCRDCAQTTWYFNRRKFEPEGAGIAFRGGKVVHVFTIWRPKGWRTNSGLALGADVASVTSRYGAMTRRACAGYYALLLPARGAVSLFYVNGRELWGFGLMRPDAHPCL